MRIVMKYSEIKIKNEKGLHARASARLVEVVDKYEAVAKIGRDDQFASGDSIMALLMLAAPKGTNISIQTSGAQEEELMEELINLIVNNFGEEN